MNKLISLRSQPPFFWTSTAVAAVVAVIFKDRLLRFVPLLQKVRHWKPDTDYWSLFFLGASVLLSLFLSVNVLLVLTVGIGTGFDSAWENLAFTIFCGFFLSTMFAIGVIDDVRANPNNRKYWYYWGLYANPAGIFLSLGYYLMNFGLRHYTRRD